ELDKLMQGMDQVPDKSVARLEKFVDELEKAGEGTSLDTKRIGINKLFNFFCPLVEQLTKMLELFSFDSETSHQAIDKVIAAAKLKRLLAPAEMAHQLLPVDSYINKVVEAAKKVRQ